MQQLELLGARLCFLEVSHILRVLLIIRVEMRLDVELAGRAYSPHQGTLHCKRVAAPNVSDEHSHRYSLYMMLLDNMQGSLATDPFHTLEEFCVSRARQLISDS